MAIQNGFFYKTWPLQGKRFNLQLGNSRRNWAEFYPMGRASIQEVQDGASAIDAQRVLTGFEYGELTGGQKQFRIIWDEANSRFTFQKNTGSQASPTWVDLLYLDPATDLATFADGAVFSGPLTGVTTYNGVDVTNLSSRLQPGGADALPTAAAVSVSTANAEGASTSFARADHVHRGVASFKKTGESNLYGNVTLSEGSGIALTQAGQDIEISTTTQETYDTTSGLSDASITTGAGETAIGWNSADTGDGHLFPGADGVKNFFVMVMLNVTKAGTPGNDTFRFRVGATGTVGDSGNVRTHKQYCDANGSQQILLAERFLSPSASDLVTISAEAVGSTLTVHGGNTMGGQICNMRIWEAP